MHYVGNTMIDTLEALSPRIEGLDAHRSHGLERGNYLLVTLHRPALVDGPLLGEALLRLEEVATELPVVFPAHPRTQAAIAAQDLSPAGFHLLPPVGYLEFLSLMSSAAGVLTDSGGVQEETTYLGIPCFTLRANTERPITTEMGTNVLLGVEPARIGEVPALLEQQRGAKARIPPLWDGRASVRRLRSRLPCGRAAGRANKGQHPAEP